MRDTERVKIPLLHGHWEAELHSASSAQGLVVHPVRASFGRKAQRIADDLADAGLSCLLLATHPSGVRERSRRRDWRQRSERLVLVCEWARERFVPVGGLGLLAFGPDAAAGIGAAVEVPHVVQALVCRNGLLAPAQSAYKDLIVPSLFVVGQARRRLLLDHHDALARMRLATTRLVLASDAALERPERGVQPETIIWFLTHLERGDSTLRSASERTDTWSERLF
jgi:hypothetical protein